jgi:integrase/recombinase XerD
VLGTASRRIYRISLATWAWPLVGKTAPRGAERRGAAPPVVPLAVLDDDDAGRKIAAAIEVRSRHADARTINRELSALRSAIGCWQDSGWIRRDATAGLRMLPGQVPASAALTDLQLAALFGVPASLREHAFWHLLHDTGADVPAVLALDAVAVDRAGRPTAHARPVTGGLTDWSERTSQLLTWLLSARPAGPLFLTDRRATAGTARADLCPLTGRARLSYRRAAEIFTISTRPLDPAGRGWTLHQLRPAGQPAR